METGKDVEALRVFSAAVSTDWLDGHFARRWEQQSELGRFLGNVPGLLERGARVLGQLDEATRNGLVPSPQIVAEIGRAEARRSRWTLRALWVIAVLLFWLALRHL